MGCVAVVVPDVEHERRHLPLRCPLGERTLALQAVEARARVDGHAEVVPDDAGDPRDEIARPAQHLDVAGLEEFRVAGELGLASVPHAGETAGADSIRDSLELLGADRIRHGIHAVDDPALVRELAERRTVLDVCPISNLRTGAVRSLEEHPLPQLMAAGVLCSLSTDDPALFGTNLDQEYETARSLGLEPHEFYVAGVEGALCDAETRQCLRRTGEPFAWDAAGALTQDQA